MKNRFFLLVLLLSMITIAGIWAQNLPGNIWESPQSITTGGRYRSNTDDFIRPDYYTGVKFNKWFGLVSFLYDENLGPFATAGFATKIKNVYIGGFYSGNFWASAPVNNYIEQELDPPPSGGVSGRVYDVYNSSISVSSPNNPVNNVAIIIGALDMGFRLTFRTNYQRFDEDGIVTGDQLYNNYHDEYGYLTPQIAWAMAKDLTKNGIRPYASFDLGFYRDYQRTETAGSDASGNSGEKIGRSKNHIDPSFAAGLGGYNFYNKDGFKLTGDLDYVLAFNIYNNEYSYEDSGVYKTGKIKGTYSPGSFPYVEQFLVSNSLTPSLSGSWSKDRIALKFKLNLALTLSTEDQNDMGLDSSNNLIYVNENDSTTTFTFRPDLRLAMQYKIIPDKLTLNVGARIRATAITVGRIYRENYSSSGTKVSTQRIHRDSYGNGFVSNFNLGATFNFTENVWTEFATGISNAYDIGVFSEHGLFYFGSILIGLRF